MLQLNISKTTTALLLSLTLGSGLGLPLSASLLNPTPVVAQSYRFADVPSNYWAVNFINKLVSRGVIAGFPDGSFKPDASVTRAQFAAMIQKAFAKENTRNKITFKDVASNYWASNAIDNSYKMGFLSGYPNQVFRPEQNIPREQVLVALANGLNYTASNNANTILDYYHDADNISDFARAPIAAATEQKIVVDYPSLKQLNPNRNATRGEVAAFIYQALVAQGQVQAVNSEYVVTQQTVATDYRITTGTIIPVTYKAEKILLTKQETVPVTLIVTSNLTNANGFILIPKGSEITGEFRPSSNGTQFVAQQLKLVDGRTYTLNAASQIITETETVNKATDLGTFLKNAALGASAAAAISAVTGDRAIATEELLIGAGAGFLASLIPQFLGQSKVDLLVVKPEDNLNLTLNKDLLFRAY